MASPIRVINGTADGTQTWQLLKSPTGAQTALTAAKLSQEFSQVVAAEDNWEAIDVSKFRSIAVQVWGVAADTNTFTLEMYGWNVGGPGHHLQQMAANVFSAFVSEDSGNASPGFHCAPLTHQSIKNAFAAGTDYRGVDTYLLTANKDFSVSLGDPTVANASTAIPAVQIQTNSETDFNSGFIVDFSKNRFKYFGIACSATTGTSVGAIFKPLHWWNSPGQGG